MKVLLTAILLFAFCIAPVSAQELSGTLLKIQKSGKINLGYRQSQPPMSFLNKDKTPAGYSIDICKNIVNKIEDKLGQTLKVNYVPVTPKDRLNALVDKKIDILCGATTKTLARSELVDFTQLTFVTGASFMTLQGNDIRGQFDGKKIGVVTGTTTADALKTLFKETGIKADIIEMKSTSKAVTALENKKIDAFAGDQVVLIGIALSHGDSAAFSILPELFSFEPIALAVRRNDADFRLMADRAISELNRSKQILKIYDKWFGSFSSTRTMAFEALVELNATPE